MLLPRGGGPSPGPPCDSSLVMRFNTFWDGGRNAELFVAISPSPSKNWATPCAVEICSENVKKQSEVDSTALSVAPPRFWRIGFAPTVGPGRHFEISDAFGCIQLPAQTGVLLLQANVLRPKVANPDSKLHRRPCWPSGDNESNTYRQEDCTDSESWMANPNFASRPTLNANAS
jgi:hypothetical protein